MAVAQSLQFSPHLGSFSHSRAEPGPIVGVSAPVEGPKGNGIGLAKGASV